MIDRKRCRHYTRREENEMTERILAERIEDLGALERAAQMHGYPLQVMPEFPLEEFAAATVCGNDDLLEAFLDAATKSPTASVCVRRP